MLDIRFVPFPTLPPETPLAIGLICDGTTAFDAPHFRTLDDAAGGALSRAAALRSFRGEAGQVVSVLAPSEGLSGVVLVGAAAGADVSAAVAAERAGGEAARALAGFAEALLVPLGGTEAFAAGIALGARLNRYEFGRYRSSVGGDASSVPAKLRAVRVAVPDTDAAARAWLGLDALSHGVTLTRDLVSEPPNVLVPAEFVSRIEALRELGLEVEVLDRAQMKTLGFGALLGVAQGSARRPFAVIVRYRGGEDGVPPLAFVGKGVTFDSGGISIKPAAGMDEMKTDMAGAATVVGLMSVLARRKAAVNAVAMVGLVENMLSGDAQRPGDIVRAYDGKTIEVLNTDAEGRLVLADLLAYTRERFTPAAIVDLATLTGAIVVSLGHEHAGLFSNDDALAAGLATAGTDVAEKLWRMPMGEAYARQLRSDIADIKNIGGRPGSAILAAEFLHRFVGETPWAHLDIAGVAYRSDASALAPKGATGFGVRLLDRFVREREGAV